ncbi:MAG: hypothetical protein M8364_10905 [Methylobacter sp.]|uniref:hypothetical protein n=1 Tax=Methylobacter sp. TaxID=2051955 RepID=UPI00258E02F3|nr:hypothetical protein [Methylobacter sp.]MCL7421399.1 hypothetical protein [Methylobacter sp.]
MKTIDRASNTAATSPETVFRMNTIECRQKKFWLPWLFGIALIYVGNPLHAGEYESPGNQPMQSEGTQSQGSQSGRTQGTERQGVGRGTKPSTGYTDKLRDQGSNTMERGRDRMRQDIDPSPGTEEMDRTPAPGSENINRDTTGPGGDNMMRDAIPGGSGINRE